LSWAPFAVFVAIAARLSAQTIAIVHAKAYLQPGLPPVPNATIVIEGGRIVAAGANVTAPAARIIDAANRMVTPGLMNSGTELGLVESGSDDTTDHAVTSGPFGAAFDVEYALNSNSTLLPLARADGLTRAVTFPSRSAGPPFTGLGAVLRLSEGPDILDKPRVALFAVTGGMTSSQVGGSRNTQWQLMREALQEAREKAHSQLVTSINLGALLPVINRSIPLVVTAYRESDIRQAIALGKDYKIRVVLYRADEAWRVAPLLAAQEIPVVLDPYDDEPATFDEIGSRLDNAAILWRAGVTISFSVPGVHMSHNAGSVIRQAAGVAVANGLPWDQALRALTLSAAETWGIADHYGTLEPGKDADLLIWNGDPLEPVNSPDMVFVRGKQVSLRTRQTELEERYAPQHAHDPWPPAYHH
jgi:imidazolonepropionase-like amidohydrolase